MVSVSGTFSTLGGHFFKDGYGKTGTGAVDWLASGECGFKLWIRLDRISLDAPPEIGHWLLPMECINCGIRDNSLDFCRSPVRRLGVFGDDEVWR
jgi:hypothetical protein